MADDTAMMLTDVYRAVNNIEQQIPKQPYATRKMSRNSIRKISVSSPIREVRRLLIFVIWSQSDHIFRK